MIDFNFALGDNKPTGPASIIYRMTFSDPVSGKCQKVRGNYTGESFAFGQNPLDPDKPPIRKFGIGFKGQRITVD